MIDSTLHKLSLFDVKPFVPTNKWEQNLKAYVCAIVSIAIVYSYSRKLALSSATVTSIRKTYMYVLYVMIVAIKNCQLKYDIKWTIILSLSCFEYKLIIKIALDLINILSQQYMIEILFDNLQII